MEIEVLKERIAKKKTQIAKMEAKRERLLKSLSPARKDIALSLECKYGTPEFLKARQAMKSEMSVTGMPAIGMSFDSFMDACSVSTDIYEAKATLSKYEKELSGKEKFFSEPKIPSIWQYLLTWAESVSGFVHRQAGEYFALAKDFDKAFDAYCDCHLDSYMKANSIRSREMAKSRLRFEYLEGTGTLDGYYSRLDPLTRRFTKIIKGERKDRPGSHEGCYDSQYVPVGYEIDEEGLAKFLDAERDSKYMDFKMRISKVAGDIVDASNLHIGEKGNLCGIVDGSKGRAYVETIPCAGYNIVRFHYRVIVKPIRA